MPTDHGYSLKCIEEYHQGTTSWRSPPDPTYKQTGGEDQVVALAKALELMSGSGMHERPSAKQVTCLKIC